MHLLRAFSCPRRWSSLHVYGYKCNILVRQFKYNLTQSWDFSFQLKRLLTTGVWTYSPSSTPSKPTDSQGSQHVPFIGSRGRSLGNLLELAKVLQALCIIGPQLFIKQALRIQYYSTTRLTLPTPPTRLLRSLSVLCHVLLIFSPAKQRTRVPSFFFSSSGDVAMMY